MRETHRSIIMKLLSMIAVFLALYIPAVILRIVLFKESGGLTCFAYGILIISGGFYVGSFFIVRRWSSSRIPAYIMILLPLALTGAVFSGAGILRTLFEAFFVLIFYLLGIRSALKDFDSILSDPRIYSCGFLIAVSFFVSFYYQNCSFLKPYIFVIAYIFMVIALIVRNQGSLDYNIFLRKSIDKAGVPGNIRSFNISAVIILSMVIVLFFNLKKLILFLLQVALKVFGIIVLLVLKLMSLLLPAAAKGENKPGGGNQPELPKAEGSGSKILDYIAIAFAIAVLLFIIYKLSPVIYRKLKAFVLFVISKIRTYFKLSAAEEAAGNEEYSDEVEMLKPFLVENRRLMQKKRKRFTARELKRITDPVQRVRYIYGVIIEMLGGRKVNITNTDTTGEILAKSKQVSGAYPGLSKMTAVYEEVRYSGSVPGNEEIAEYEEDFREVSEVIRDEG